MKLKVHILHAQYLANRAALVQLNMQTLHSLGMEVKLVLDKDPNLINQDDAKLLTNAPVPDPELAYFNAVLKPMQITAISNALKHRFALESASKDPSCLHLVLEDDTVFSSNFSEHIKQAMNAYKSNSIVCLGVPVNGESVDRLKSITDMYKVLPCCEAYIVDASTATKMLAEYSSIRFPNNIQMTYTALKHKISLQAYDTTITVDGTKLGLFASTIEINNRLVFNQTYIALLNIINKAGNLSPEDIKSTNNLFASVDYKNNPEFFYLKAKLETRKKNYDYALALYQRAYTLYENQGTPLGQGSDFMQDYMKLHIHFQD
jgi:GR25 family glycosyltransferase involved in LPS biosynthesis